MDKKKRSACDRCHYHKLRCLKQRGYESCERCLKGGKSCTFSTSMRGFRSHTVKAIKEADLAATYDAGSLGDNSGSGSGSGLELTPPVRENGLDFTISMEEQNSFDSMLMDWSENPHGTETFQPFILPSNSDLSHFQERYPFQDTLPTDPSLNTTTDPSANSYGNDALYSNLTMGLSCQDDHYLTSEAKLTTDMAELVIKLTKHLATIPSLSAHKEGLPMSTSQSNSARQSNMNPGNGATAQTRTGMTASEYNNIDGYEFSLDQTFHLTETTINLYPRFMKIFFRRYSPQSPKITSDGPNSSQPPESSSLVSPNNPSPDHSSIFLLLSCHYRAMDIWESIFRHMEICLSHPADQTNKVMTYPVLKIGNVQSSLSSAIPMEFMMIAAFMTMLSDGISELVDEISKPSMPERYRITGDEGEVETAMDDCSATVIACRQLMAKANDMVKMASNFRRKIVGISK